MATHGNSTGARARTASALAAKWSIRATVWLGYRPSRSRPRQSIRPWSAGAASGLTRCACGPRARSIRSGSMPSMQATTPARWPKKCAPKASFACCIQRIPALLGRNSGCGRSISSPRPRFRTSSAAICRPIPMCRACPTRRRSSSTTRTPPSRSPRSCGCWSMSTASSSTKRGTSRAAPWATPTTPCCPRHWNHGRCRCSNGCCHATCKSSTRSTAAYCVKRARPGWTAARFRRSA